VNQAPFTFRSGDVTDRHADPVRWGAECCLTKGFTLENKPNRDRGGADGRNCVGDVRGVGEADCEHAG
jgi:hypothetical protein